MNLLSGAYIYLLFVGFWRFEGVKLGTVLCV